MYKAPARTGSEIGVPEGKDSFGGVLSDYITAIGQGATNGHTDEVAGAMGTLLGRDYETTRDQARDRYAQVPEHTKAIGGLMGALIPGTAIAKGLAKGAKAGRGLYDLYQSGDKLRDIGKLIGVGGAEAGISAHGYSESDDPTGEMLVGGVLGSALGGVFGGAQGGIQGMKPENFANRLLRRDFKEGRTTPAKAEAALEQNPNAILADTNPVLQGRLGKLAQNPAVDTDAVREATMQRGQGSFERIGASMRRVFGNDSVSDAMEAAVARRKADAQPLYALADETPVKVNKNLAELLNLPGMDEVLGGAMTIMQKSRDNADKIQGLRNLMQAVESVAGGSRKQYNVRNATGSLQFVKESLEDQIDSAFRNGQNHLGNAMKRNLDEIMEEMDVQNPAWKRARDVWKGEKDNERALDVGRTAFSKVSSVTEKAVNKMGDVEFSHFQTGVFENVADVMEGRAPGTNLAALVESTKRQGILKLAFGDDALYKKFVKELGDEDNMNATMAQAMKNPVIKDWGKTAAVSPFFWYGQMARGLNAMVEPWRRSYGTMGGRVLAGRDARLPFKPSGISPTTAAIVFGGSEELGRAAGSP